MRVLVLAGLDVAAIFFEDDMKFRFDWCAMIVKGMGMGLFVIIL